MSTSKRLSGIISPPARPRSNSTRRHSRILASANLGRRESVADRKDLRKLVESKKNDPDTMQFRAEAGRQGGIRRWDGNGRTTTEWDSIKRDPELWFPSGDCLIHFYERGLSRRGPSLRVAITDLEATGCSNLLAEHLVPLAEPDSPAFSEDSSSDDGGFFTNPNARGKFELYIPSPAGLSREDALEYHLTTRNFFAWMFDRPLVGRKLGDALIALQQRMDEYRSDAQQNQEDLLAYIELQGYSDFRDCPHHALAALRYAEHFQLKDLWTDAFVHCSGMNDILIDSHDFTGISRTTKALITRASLEMTLRLEKSSKALANFMEDETANPYLELSEPILKHLERFRSFLNSFYVQKHGYWPPYNMNPRQGRAPPLAKHTLLTMYSDFRNLYDFLKDTDSSEGENITVEGNTGAFNVSITTTKFDKRRKHTSLPHALPLVPTDLSSPPAPQRNSFYGALSLNWLTGGSAAAKRNRLERRQEVINALQNSTNIVDPRVMSCSLVREYGAFEREYTLRGAGGEKIDPVDARRARWLLVYMVLQTLIDVTRAPKEVQNTEGVEYPLCCQTAGTPPWTVAGASTAEEQDEEEELSAKVDDIMAPFYSLQVNLPITDCIPSPDSAEMPAPLDLALVASKRLSLNKTKSFNTVSTVSGPATPPRNEPAFSPEIIAPQPRRLIVPPSAPSTIAPPSEMDIPARSSSRIGTRLGRTSAATTPPQADDVPALSPTASTPTRLNGLGRHNSDSRSDGSSDLATPTESNFPQQREPAQQQQQYAYKRVSHMAPPLPPPSPSIYEEDEGMAEEAWTGGQNISDLNLGRTSGKEVAGGEAEALARRWREEIA